MADQKLETMTGRVYRLAPKNRKAARPTLDLSTAASSAQALQSPNQETRYLAWTKLAELKAAAEPELDKIWRGTQRRQRARALHLLARNHATAKRYLDEAVQDADANIRVAAVRIAAAEKLDVLGYAKTGLQDRSPQVWRECALALRHNTSPEAAQLWAQLAKKHRGQDRWYVEALGIGADQQWDPFLDAWLAQVGDQWNAVAGRDIIWRSRAKKTPGLLAKLIADKGTPPESRDELMRAFDFAPAGPEKDAALLEVLTSATSGK